MDSLFLANKICWDVGFVQECCRTYSEISHAARQQHLGIRHTISLHPHNYQENLLAIELTRIICIQYLENKRFFSQHWGLLKRVL